MTAPSHAPSSRSPLISSAVLGVVCVLVGVYFLRWTVLQPEVLIEAFAFHRGDLDAGRWWSVATYTLVQSSATMLFVTCYALLVFGPRLVHLVDGWCICLLGVLHPSLVRRV